MRDQVDHLKDLNRERCTPRPDRSEVADIWLQSGFTGGFSMEWVLDRYDHTVTPARRHL
ncbi:hypothetical protein [uncultured Tateyamaria sp.]|uniref:hypothetical protein n=1 Tax=uncultured Tateyamaria sp. TaxID=455651 RepID=UPI00261B103B|nr:hypothetical protein [uncultured Tateyamaria sp.]